MNVVESLVELRSARGQIAGTFGLVPTMGFLHEGHLSLVRRAREECDFVGVSIFVNPTQFGPEEDLAAYPRDLERDLALLDQENADLVWTPPPEEVYSRDHRTWVDVEELTDPLEGRHRPDHFRGVTTMVAKLFNCFQPDRAYFGQKDAQQSVVIRRMVADLNFPLEIVVCPTVREPDGLAMSSRNSYLSTDERAAATVLYRALTKAANSATREAAALRHTMHEVLAGEPLVRPQYVSAADPETLRELEGPIDRALLSLAVNIGQTRLIDNMLIG